MDALRWRRTSFEPIHVHSGVQRKSLPPRCNHTSLKRPNQVCPLLVPPNHACFLLNPKDAGIFQEGGALCLAVDVQGHVPSSGSGSVLARFPGPGWVFPCPWLSRG